MSEEAKMDQLARVAWIIDGETVVINKGSSDGVRVGARYLIYAIAGEIEDPVTGESLGNLEIVRGRGRVIHVQAKMATLKSTEQRVVKPARRIKRDEIRGALSLLNPRIEEDMPAETEIIPFSDVELGDYAKPI